LNGRTALQNVQHLPVAKAQANMTRQANDTQKRNRTGTRRARLKPANLRIDQPSHDAAAARIIGRIKRTKGWQIVTKQGFPHVLAQAPAIPADSGITATRHPWHAQNRADQFHLIGAHA
jgi:hypothetical protein